MEIAGINHAVSMKRVAGIVNSVSRYYPEISVPMPRAEEVWHGLRPCSPDGLPYLGVHPRLRNVMIATGHAMLGVSLGAGTGKIVADLIKGEKSEVDLAPFSPARFA